MSIYISIAAHKSKLTENDVTDGDSYKNAKKSAIYKGIGSCIYFAFFLYLWNAIMEKFIDGGSFLGALFHPEGVAFQFVIGGIIFGIAIYIQWIIRIKKMK